ncbi:MAG: multidrug resistance protein Stp [Sphingomonas bacterium]|uniref:MFS transporter n=1 Tax=Sphingomonas bacterium TaxID=1895847 RepID=UPI00263697EE|nr:MFS transporter [Sphingomonas bacterium]MDB5705363.1 multidrug resistance protein Stp [Sphingomonas bacterium]
MAKAQGGTGALIATVLGSSVAWIDGSVVNVALPAMARALDADSAGVQWIVNGYMLPLSALVLIGGALADSAGRKRTFLAGLLLFAIASIGCMVAPTLGWLIGARVGQGLGAALLVPASLAILGADFEGAARAKAIGTWAAAGAIGGAIGPVLGGWLVDHVGWRSIFALIVPIAVAAGIMGWRFVPDGHDKDAEPPDWYGAMLATVGLGLLVGGLTLMSSGTRGTGAAMIGGGTIALIAFVSLEARLGERAMVPLALFGTRTFTGLTLLTFLLYAALGGTLLLLPYLLIARGWSATAAGTAVLPLPLIMGLGSRAVGGLADRIGARPLLAMGPMVTGAGLALFALLPEGEIDYVRNILPAMLLIGIGMTAAVAPLTTTVMAAVDHRHTGAASGVNNATARIGGMIAVALIGLVLSDNGRGVSLGAFHGAAMTAAVMAVVAGLCGWLLVRPGTG